MALLGGLCGGYKLETDDNCPAGTRKGVTVGGGHDGLNISEGRVSLPVYWRRKWQPIPVFLPGKFCGQRILVGYSPWGRKELDTTEHPIFTHILCPPTADVHLNKEVTRSVHPGFLSSLLLSPFLFFLFLIFWLCCVWDLSSPFRG